MKATLQNVLTDEFYTKAIALQERFTEGVKSVIKEFNLPWIVKRLGNLAAIQAGKHIALANKETLVIAGAVVMPLAKQAGVRILPVDSEHSAIFQALQGNHRKHLRRILLTASGGPFFRKSLRELVEVNPQAALRHPN